MATENLSRRQQYTVKILQETYIDMLKEKTSGSISVVELCGAAEVNRTTFYRYFTDIEDLKSYMISDLFNQIFSPLNALPTDASHSSQKRILQALNATIKNRKLCRHLLSESHTDLAEQSLEKNITVIRDTILSTGCTEADADLCYGYICGGLARLWITWIDSDFKTPKEKVALMIEEFIMGFYNLMSNGFILKNPG